MVSMSWPRNPLVAEKSKINFTKILQKKNGDDSDDADKEKCGVAKLSHCLCVKLERRKDLQWVSCSDCSQWFHVYCLRLNNQSYTEEDVFSCCGPNASPEAVASLAGEVAAQYRELKHTTKIEAYDEALKQGY